MTPRAARVARPRPTLTLRAFARPTFGLPAFGRPALALSALALPALALLPGCQEAPWQPSAVAEFDTETFEAPASGLGPDFFPFEPGPDDPTPPRDTAYAGGAPKVHFLNFCDGTTTLKKGSDNATKNSSSICGHSSAGCVKYTGSAADKKAFIDTLQTMWLPYNMVIVTKRPASGLYSMEMISPPGNGCDMGPSVGGVAPGDCGDRSAVNVSFTFSTKGLSGLPGYVVTAQETGHAWGLSHVDTACDVMGAAYSRKGCPGGKWGFPDATAAVIDRPVCTGQTTQNSHTMLLKNLGPWEGGPKPPPDGMACDDKTPPSVTITEPAAGAKVSAPFKVKADVADDCLPIKKAKITVPALSISAEATMAPFDWTIEKVGATKALEITVESWDGKDQMTKKTITVEVTGAPGGGAGGGGSGGGGSGGGGNGGSGSPEDPSPPRVSGGCATGGGGSSEPAGAAMAFALALIGLATAAARAGHAGSNRQRR